MPSHLEAVSVVKLVSVAGGNTERNLPVVIASVIVIDGETGQPLALMDGSSLTAIRTGAGAGLATELLAKPEASILGVIGAGVQARTQIEAVCTVRRITEIRVYCRTLAKSQALVDELQPNYDARLRAVNSEADALQGADVIVAATSSADPVVHRQYVSPGAHINGVGSYTPQMQEVDADIVTQAKVVVDHRDSVWEEAGDLIIPRDQGLFKESDIYAEIGEIAAEKLPGRTSDDEITFFKSVGNAVQDNMAAQYVLLAAHRYGFGTEITLN
jgi:ornithine cyclodeaminase/alanine dehydrogenase-like protein (mu-crystallin family)